MKTDEQMNELFIRFFEIIGKDLAPIAGEIVGTLKRDKKESSPFFNEEYTPQKRNAEILSFPTVCEEAKEEKPSTCYNNDIAPAIAPAIAQPTTEDKGIFEFKITKEEIKKMPKIIKNGRIFAEGFSVCYRIRKTGKNSFTYNVRFKKCGFNIDFSDKKKENLKPRFISILKKQAEEMEQKNASGVPVTFDSFATYYFENVMKKKVTEGTYYVNMRRYKLYLKPTFQERKLVDILPNDCQKLIDSITEQGKGKTADDVYSVLNGIFKFAISNYIISRNPLSPVVHTQHEREHGTALTKEEEKILLSNPESTINERIAFAVSLYTGMRPNELQTARVDGDFIIAVNSKRKTRKVEYKKIPISPMLKPYIKDFDCIKNIGVRRIRIAFKKIFPAHKLYDLRTTFYTRCQECGVAEVARKEFAGHSFGGLADTYTDLSDEFLLKEGQKLNY